MRIGVGVETRDAAVTVLGVPVEAGAGQPGCLMGPAALRTAGAVERLRRLGLAVEDEGDLAPLEGPEESLGHARNATTVAAWTRALSERAYQLAGGERTPVFLGGDHSLAMGSINGVARRFAEQNRPLYVLWLDAHADFNTPATSPSGNMHGMPLAYLCGEPGLEPFAADVARSLVPPDHVHILGARSIDAGERRLLAGRGVHVVDMRQIDEHGVSVPMRRILGLVRAAGGVLHVSLDVDVLDPQIAPGVGTTVPGGLTYREAHLIMELIHESGLMGSLDVVELNPFLDERGRSACVLAELVASAFGQSVIERATPAGWALPSR